MKRVLLVMSMWLVLAVPASAHYLMHSYDAAYYGKNIARQDCGRAWDWTCWNFPISGPTVWGCTDHTWCVRTWYEELHIYSLGRRTCYTDVHYTHGVQTYRGKFC